MSSATTREEELSGQEHSARLPAPEPHKALPAPKKPTNTAARKWIILAVILLAVGAAIWVIRRNGEKLTAQSQKMEAAMNRPTPVQTQPVQQRTMPIYLTALGTVTAYNTVTIKPRVDGQLLRVNFREGQAVSKGQLLLEIDPRPYQAALAQAEGQLAKDQASAKNADAEAARYTALYQAGVVSKESQQTQISNAGQATGSIQADQAAIQAARVNLTYTRVTSPIDGVVGLRQVDPGNIVHASDANGLVVVTQIHPIAVIFTLPEDQLPQVRERTRSGQKLVVDAYDRSDTAHLASGALLTIDNQIDTTTGTDKVKAVFDNKDGALFPNQFVNIRLILEQRRNALVLPSVAIQTGTQGSFVYVVKPGEPPADKQESAPAKDPAARTSQAGGGSQGGPSEQGRGPSFYVEAVPVKVEITEGSRVILSGGVNPGDQVVVDGLEKLKDGARVIPRAGVPTGSQKNIGSGNDTQPAGRSAEADAAAQGHAADEPRGRQRAQRGRQP
ncbi:MAG: MdtA/MuxA family multidrug efflux RND transporter periplasmic adaptor subunit [Acidobacteriaceae bacterium]